MTAMPDHEMGDVARDVFGPPPKGTCTWIMFEGAEPRPCGKPAEFHLVWDPSNGSPLCREHAQPELDSGASAWPTLDSNALAIHPYTDTCRLEEAVWDEETNRCVLPQEAA